MTIQENVEKLSTLIKDIERLDKAAKMAIRLHNTNQYSKINIIDGNGSDFQQLHQVFTTIELATIATYIYDTIIKKKEALTAELNSHIISKQL